MNEEIPMKVLNAVIRAMEEVVASDKELNMAVFYEHEELLSKSTTIHNCETAACICGYTVLDPEVSRLVKDTDPVEVWRCVEDEVGLNVAGSMFDCHPETRKEEAEATDVLKPLLEHPHLNTESNAETALDYLKQVRELLA